MAKSLQKLSETNNTSSGMEGVLTNLANWASKKKRKRNFFSNWPITAIDYACTGYKATTKVNWSVTNGGVAIVENF